MALPFRYRARFAGLTILCLTLTSACHSNEKHLSLKDFPPLQQTTDYTCGCASALAVMHYYGITDETESSLATKMHTHVDSRAANASPGSAVCLTDFGTSIEEIYRYFDSRNDLSVIASNYHPSNTLPIMTDTARVGVQAVGNVEPPFADYSEAALFLRQQLEAGRPVMVCWNLWGGHWTVCIGYNDRGTPEFFDDDLLTMADPYDSTDGRRDGFTEVSLVAFFYDWFCTMTPKPWQLQPYIVVAPQ